MRRPRPAHALRRRRGRPRHRPRRARAARSSRCSARTAPARRRPSRSSRASARPTRARCRCSAPTRATRRASGATGSASCCRSPRRRPASPCASACSLYAGYYSEPRDVDETLALVGLEEQRRPGGGEAVRRPAPPARRRARADRRPRDDLPRRADDRLRPGRAPPQAWEVIGGLRALGKTILLTTHYMEEAERLADRIVVMARGEIVADGTPATLGGRDRAAAIVSFTLPPGAGEPPRRRQVDERGRVDAPHRAPDGRAARADRLGARPRSWS